MENKDVYSEVRARRSKMSAARKKYWTDNLEARARAAARASANNPMKRPEARARASTRMKRMWADPVVRRKRSAAIKEGLARRRAAGMVQ